MLQYTRKKGIMKTHILGGVILADKKSLFDKYKIIGEDGQEKSAEQHVPSVPGEIIDIPIEDDLPELEALTGFPNAVKEALEKLPVTEEVPVFEEGTIVEKESEPVEEIFELDEEVARIIEEITEPVEELPIEISEVEDSIIEGAEENFVEEDVQEFVEEPQNEDFKKPDNENVVENDTDAETVEEISETSETDVVIPVLPKKEKKVKKTKPPKEKKVKEPKPPKVKKTKESKTDNKDAPPPEPLTMKDHLTFGLAIFALILAIVFLCVKYFPANNNDNPQMPENTIEEVSNKLSSIQIQREGIDTQLIQSDIDTIFYTVSSANEVQYYKYSDNRMNSVEPKGTISANVDMGKESLPVTIKYVEENGKVFGIGIFDGITNSQYSFYDTVVFKLTDLPQGYTAKGYAMLLATTSSQPITQKGNIWTESFIIDVATGEMTRFLSVADRGDDVATGLPSSSYCILTDECYTEANTKIPFFTTREYALESGKKDIFVKDKDKEALFASDVYGDFVMADGEAIIYLKSDETSGFNVMRKENGKETTVLSLHGALSTEYIHNNEYFLDKTNGILYNVKTGKQTALVGYRMVNPEMISVSPDGKCLVVLGTVNNIMDYQIHIFDLETGKYMKYEDENFSQHGNLVFIDNTTVAYTAVDPNQGFEYVILDVAKAFEK